MVAVLSGRWASRTASRSNPGISHSVGISGAASRLWLFPGVWLAIYRRNLKNPQDLLGDAGWRFRDRRKGDLEGRTLAGVAVDIDPAAVALDHLPNQVEADSRAGDVAQLRALDPVELFEQPPLGGGRDAEPVVLDHQVDVPILAAAAHLDARRPVAELHRVLQQVVDGGAEPLRIAQGREGRRRQLDLERAVLQLHLRPDPPAGIR